MGAPVTVLHVNFVPFVWHFSVPFGAFFFFVPVLFTSSFLISQRSPRLFSDDQVPENVEQRACQLAALLESRPAMRHQVTTALPIGVLYKCGILGTEHIWGQRERKIHQNMMTTALQSYG